MHNYKKPLILAGALMATATIAPVASADVVACNPDKIYFRTTQWLDPFSFNLQVAGQAAPLELVTVGTALTPSAIIQPPQGGVFWKNLEVAPGFKIKKVLVCTNAISPVDASKAISVSLSQALKGNSVPLNYQRQAASQTSCGVYTVTGSIDELGHPGTPVNPAASPTTLTIATPASPNSHITAIGLRLQAIGNSPLWTFVPDHQHAYRTGRGVGHNNTVALTSGPTEACDGSAAIDFSDLDDAADFVPALPTLPTASLLPLPKKGKKK